MEEVPSDEIAKLGRLAVEMGLVTAEEVARAASALAATDAVDEPAALARALREQEAITEEEAAELLAEHRLHTSETDRVQPWIIPAGEGAAAPAAVDPDATAELNEESSPEPISPEEAAQLLAGELAKSRPPRKPVRLAGAPPGAAPPGTAPRARGVPGLAEAIPIKGYELLEEISQDETGMLYRASQIAMDRLVLIKILRPDHTGSKAFVERFLREARMAGQFNHPNLVRVHEVGRAGKHYFYSMEHVEGRTLDAAVRQAGALQPRRACEIVRDLASALEQWEKRKLVHGEVRPGTIILTEDGVPKLSGLGLAARNEKASVLAGGGVHFVAPELALTDAFDSRADIYALGGVIFFILTGKAPHPGSSAKQVLAASRRGAPDLKPYFAQIPQAIGAIVTRAMQPNPERRYPGFESFLSALDEILLRGTAMGAPLGPRPAPRLKTRKIRRRRR